MNENAPFSSTGTEWPWIEAILLAKNASHVTTLEYVAIETDDPRVTTVTPEEMAERVREGLEDCDGKGMPQFDAVVTFSSLEHSGLGE